MTAASRGLAGIPPFNWTLTQNEIATATIERSSGLVIDYGGEAATPLAEQTVLLEPQAYRLTYSAQGEAPGEGGKQVNLRILCLPDRNVIHEGSIQTGSARAFDFAVPSACPAQLISIDGAPGEFPSQRQITLRSLKVTAR